MARRSLVLLLAVAVLCCACLVLVSADGAPKKTAGAAAKAPAAAKAAHKAADLSEEGMRAKFAEFKAKFRPHGYSSPANEARAYATFKHNRLQANELNTKHGKGKRVWSSLTPFTDMDPAEFAKTRKGAKPGNLAKAKPTAKPSKTLISRAHAKTTEAKSSSSKKATGKTPTPGSSLAAPKKASKRATASAKSAAKHALLEVGNAKCTDTVDGVTGTEMAAGTRNEDCMKVLGTKSATWEPTRSVTNGGWCCVPELPSVTIARCTAKSGTCLSSPNWITTTCDAAGGHRVNDASGFCPPDANGVPEWCCLIEKPVTPPTPAPVVPPTPQPDANGITWIVDYRNKITPVKDQKQCGSCWAHSAVETLESAVIHQGGASVQLSTQQIMDCNRGGVASCVPDLPTAQFTRWQTYKSVQLADYPYFSVAGQPQACNANAPLNGPGVKTWGFATPACHTGGDCPSQDENQLLVSLQNYGPISIIIDATPFNMYHGGIIPASSCSIDMMKGDHAISLVGAGTDKDGQKFWLVRNSWGAAWGEAGFARLEFGKNACGIANWASFVTV